MSRELARKQRRGSENDLKEGSSTSAWKCSEPLIRTLEMKNCQDADDCKRRYMMTLPPIACDETVPSTTILPVMFTIHCLGCSLDTLAYFSDLAIAHNFVWINPEGLQRSFHAGNACCGYAMKQNVDDIGFFKQILEELRQIYSFISPQHVYAMGWSNGGYMASHAANLFQAIVPVSGYQIESLPQKPTAIWLHHATDDTFVRPTGCCTDTTMPPCCCQLSQAFDTCTSVEQQMQVWAKHNACNFDMAPTTTEHSDLQVTCYVYQECKATTRYCLHAGNVGHFNRGGFQKMFPFSQEIVSFFAEHMCLKNNGVWNGATCTCPDSNPEGPYCVAQAQSSSQNQSLQTPPTSQDTWQGTPFTAALIAMTLLACLLAATLVWRGRRTTRRTSTSQAYEPIARSEMELSRTYIKEFF
jgi:poly(3-hydroxybutyrate) depolymerase